MHVLRRNIIKKSVLSLLDIKINKMPETRNELYNATRDNVIFILVIEFSEYSRLEKEGYYHENLLIIYSENEVLPELPLELDRKKLICFKQPKLKGSIFKKTNEEDSINYMLNGILKFIKESTFGENSLPIIMLSPKLKKVFKLKSYSVHEGKFNFNFMNLSCRDKIEKEGGILGSNRDGINWLKKTSYVNDYLKKITFSVNKILDNYPKDDELNYLRKRLEFITKKLRPLTLSEYFALDHLINMDKNLLEEVANLKGIQCEDKINNEIEELAEDIKGNIWL